MGFLHFNFSGYKNGAHKAKLRHTSISMHICLSILVCSSMTKKRKVEVDDDEDEDEDLNFDTKPTENVHAKNSSSSKEDLTKLLNPFPKQHFIQILLTAAFNSPKILKQINQVADLHYAHRKLFVHVLNRDTTTLLRLQLFFSKYGEVEDSLIILDKETRQSKGFGFIVFKSRQSAEKAMKDRPKMLDNRFIFCNLASDNSSSTPPSYYSSPQDLYDRRIYVGNVHTEIPAYKLYEFFSKYGEIEKGPLGFDINTVKARGFAVFIWFDINTGKARGFAVFIYKTAEGARRALEEPMKRLYGFPLMYCDKAKASSSSPPSPSPGLHECGVNCNYAFTSMGTFGCGSSGLRGCGSCGRGGESNAAVPKPATVLVGGRGGGGGGDLQRDDSLFTMFMFHLFFILFCLLVLISK